jgi:hypothetical protein
VAGRARGVGTVGPGAGSLRTPRHIQAVPRAPTCAVAKPDLDYREEGGVHWVRLPSYPVPPGWTLGQVEACFQIPAMAGQAPYAFRVRPLLVRADGSHPGNYTYPVATHPVGRRLGPVLLVPAGMGTQSGHPGWSEHAHRPIVR